VTEKTEPTPIYERITPEEIKQTDNGGQRVGWVVAADPKPRTKPIREYQLVLVPAVGGTEFSIFKCTDDILLPSDAAMVILGPVSQMQYGDYQYNLLYGHLVIESETSGVEPENYISLPPEMRGTVIPETKCGDEELWREICSSVTTTEGVAEPQSEGSGIRSFAQRLTSWWN
jgi:hypothetical protein